MVRLSNFIANKAMSRMNISQIENNIKSVFLNINKDSFIYDFLLSYNIPKASAKKLKDGGTNLSNIDGEILWKKKLFYKIELIKDLHEIIDSIRGEGRVMKHAPRFIIVTNFETFLSLDTITLDSLDIPFLDLPKHYDFFLPLAGMEKAKHQFEKDADVKAAERMGKLYDEIKKDNSTSTPEEVHSLNVFLTKLLFCFFAEDTNIFEKGQFTGSISSHTQQDGSDLNTYFERLFEVMNTAKDERGDIPEFLNAFPYVNGGLFRDYHLVPSFSRRSRQIIIESGELDWSAINPDIFGSMIQAVITPEHRGGLGMHYTSVPNIMKVIEPLFLNELNEEFEKGKHEPRKLYNLLERLGAIKIFDPACGSGNFLIIAYKELRQLEIKILNQLKNLQSIATGFEPKQLELIPKQQLTLAASFQIEMFSRVELSQFYGIELDDFAHEVAILSLWLAQHQMNIKFKEIFGSGNPTLPLQNGGNIVHGNATRLNWEVVCHKNEADEIYILGNPPFLGSRYQLQTHKEDLDFVIKDINSHRKLDYVACWFYLATNFIYNSSNTSAGFVSTNSITQGEQANLLFSYIFNKNIEIEFAYKTFPWKNNAKNQAAVEVVIIGLKKFNKSVKKLYDGLTIHMVEKINAYLSLFKIKAVEKRNSPLSFDFKMVKGCYPTDGEGLILNQDQIKEVENNIKLSSYIKPFIGTTEFLHDKKRFCLYFNEDEYNLVKEDPFIKERIEIVIQSRLSSKKENTRKLASVPYKFEFDSTINMQGFMIPCITSQRRKYIPIGISYPGEIVYGTAQVLYSKELYIFGILSSRLHVLWMSVTCGRMKSDFNYSSTLCYNTFPFPSINSEMKIGIERHVINILNERQNYSEKTMAQLYDPDKMPKNLESAHYQLDLAIEKCYRSKPFESDEERLEYLFKLYEQMIEDENSKGTLFEVEPKQKKKKK
jgi:hypothetical protein